MNIISAHVEHFVSLQKLFEERFIRIYEIISIKKPTIKAYEFMKIISKEKLEDSVILLERNETSIFERIEIPVWYLWRDDSIVIDDVNKRF